MTNELKYKRKVNSIYMSSNAKLHSMIFFRDYSEGYVYSIKDKALHDDFFAVEPASSQLNKVLQSKYHHSLSYEIEQIVGRLIYALMYYGKAYVYINPIYEESIDENGNETKSLLSLELGDIRGVPAKKTNDHVEFWGIGFTGKVSKRIYDSKGFISLDIKALGYSRKFFKRLVKKLDKYDITSSTLALSNVDGYDFHQHMIHNNIHSLKITRKYGWTFSTDDLSESQILYRRINQSKFKIELLNYIVTQLNDGFKSVLNDDSGKLIMKLKGINYEDVWNKYDKGIITTSELSRMLY